MVVDVAVGCVICAQEIGFAQSASTITSHPVGFATSALAPEMLLVVAVAAAETSLETVVMTAVMTAAVVVAAAGPEIGTAPAAHSLTTHTVATATGARSPKRAVEVVDFLMVAVPAPETGSARIASS